MRVIVRIALDSNSPLPMGRAALGGVGDIVGGSVWVGKVSPGDSAVMKNAS